MKKLLITIGLSFILFLSIVIIKDQFEHILLKNANYGLVNIIKNKKIDNLFIGSSMFRHGVDAKVLEENNLDSYILSYNGNNPSLELWVIKYLINKNVEINNLYVDMYAYSLTTKPSISDSKILMEADLKGKYELYKLLNEKPNFNDFYSIFVSSNIDILLTYPIYYPIINNTFYKGSITNGKDGISDDKLANLELIPEANIDNRNIEAIIELIKLCKDNNINLTYIETPKSYIIANNPHYQDLMNNYKNILNKFETNFYLASDIDNNISNDASNYYDLIHLSNSGREKYSTSLGKFLKNKD